MFNRVLRLLKKSRKHVKPLVTMSKKLLQVNAHIADKIMLHNEMIEDLRNEVHMLENQQKENNVVICNVNNIIKGVM